MLREGGAAETKPSSGQAAKQPSKPSRYPAPSTARATDEDTPSGRFTCSRQHGTSRAPSPSRAASCARLFQTLDGPEKKRESRKLAHDLQRQTGARTEHRIFRPQHSRESAFPCAPHPDPSEDPGSRPVRRRPLPPCPGVDGCHRPPLAPASWPESDVPTAPTRPTLRHRVSPVFLSYERARRYICSG